MKTFSPRHIPGALVGVIAACFVCMALGASAAMTPRFGANGADFLRSIFGDAFVAKLETFVYSAKDQLDQLQFNAGLKKADLPWQLPSDELPIGQTNTNPAASAQKADEDGKMTDAASSASPNSAGWPLPAAQPFSQIKGEGEWLPYLRNKNGEMVAARTFLNPDPQRPYVSVGVVAFDLTRTRLGFVAGTEEPVSATPFTRTGRIPPNDFVAGKLIAVFNGGFKTTHGKYGAMFNGRLIVPARDNMMTIALDKDSAIRIGKWGQPGLVTTNTVSWRQNGPPMIDAGAINPLTHDMTASNWGANLDGSVAVWRSSLGLSKDGKTLFYAAGNALVTEPLANAMQRAGAWNAMQLDINNYWVHFDAVRADTGAMKTEALFDSMSKQDDDRYLKSNKRDFFYVVTQ